MKNRTSSLKIGVGTPTILMIFVVLCMVILSVLSYQQAQTQSQLVAKEKKYVEDYYGALAKSELIQNDIQDLMKQGITMLSIKQQIEDKYDIVLKSDETSIVYDTIIDENKQIHIQLMVRDPQKAKVWKVESRREMK